MVRIRGLWQGLRERGRSASIKAARAERAAQPHGHGAGTAL